MSVSLPIKDINEVTGVVYSNSPAPSQLQRSKRKRQSSIGVGCEVNPAPHTSVSLCKPARNRAHLHPETQPPEPGTQPPLPRGYLYTHTHTLIPEAIWRRGGRGGTTNTADRHPKQRPDQTRSAQAGFRSGDLQHGASRLSPRALHRECCRLLVRLHSWDGYTKP